jgi:hypothetical protein
MIASLVWQDVVMVDFDTTRWEWNHSDYSAAAVGDSGPWVWWLPLAWRAVADQWTAGASVIDGWKRRRGSGERLQETFCP